MTTAPTNGMNAARNTSTAIGTTSDQPTPSSSATRPMPTASMSATRICTRAYSPTDIQAARPPPSTAARARRGARRTHQRQMPSPSMRKNSVRNSDSTSPTRMSETMEAPESAPARIVPEFFWTVALTEEIAPRTSASVMPSGEAFSVVRRLW